MTVQPPAPSIARSQRHRTVQSIADRVVEQIEQSISHERLVPGSRIGTKIELAEQYGIAPATLGEAMRVLRARGVIEVRPGPGGGVFVAQQSPLIKLAYDVMQLRAHGASVNDVLGVLDALDEAIIRDATIHRTDADLASLDALIDDLARVWSDPVEGVHCNWQLHRRIARISPNVVLRTFYLNLVDYVEGEGSFEDSLGVPEFRPDTEDRLAVHRELVAAIRSGDESRARESVLRHRTY
jgi:DNA-binding FadR family transcriptional regulator